MKKIYLIDCPGVVYNPQESDEEKVLRGVVRVELVENPADYIPAVLSKVKLLYMARTYKIRNDWKDANDFLEKVAQKYGKLESWISYMFDLIHSTKDSDKKNSKKVTCRHFFGLGRKMGRNGCRA